MGGPFLRIHGACTEDLLIIGIRVTGGLRNDLFSKVRSSQIGAGKIVGVASQHDIRATAGHVGGDGYRSELTGLRNDLCFLLMLFCIEDIMLDAAFFQHGGQQLTFFNGDRADQDRLPFFMTCDDLFDDRPVFSGIVFIDHVRIVDTLNRFVGGDLHDIQLIDRAEFLFFRQCRTSHAGQLVKQTEIVLERYGCQRLVLLLNIDILFRFNCLMQTFRIAAPKHDTSGKLIHDEHFAVLHHIVDIPFHNTVGTEGLIDMVGKCCVFDICQILQAEELLCLGDTTACECRGAEFFIHDVISIQAFIFLFLGIGRCVDNLFQSADELIRSLIQIRGLAPLPGNDKRCSRLIDKDGVHLVHDGKVVSALNHMLFVNGHVISKIIKAHFIVCTICNIAGIRRTAFFRGFVMNDQANGNTHEPIDLSHPFRVTLGQIIIDRDNMHAILRQSIQVCRKDRDQRLAFTGFHFSNSSLMQYDTADDLNAEGLHTEDSPAGFPSGSKGFRQNIVQGLTLCKALLELRSLGFQLIIRQFGILVIQRFHLVGDGI